MTLKPPYSCPRAYPEFLENLIYFASITKFISIVK